MSWPLYIRIGYGPYVGVATGWRAGVVDLALLTLAFLTLRLLYRAMCFFLSGEDR